MVHALRLLRLRQSNKPGGGGKPYILVARERNAPSTSVDERGVVEASCFLDAGVDLALIGVVGFTGSVFGILAFQPLRKQVELFIELPQGGGGEHSRLFQ